MLYHIWNELCLTEVDPSFSLSSFVYCFQYVFRWDNSFTLGLLSGIWTVSFVREYVFPHMFVDELAHLQDGYRLSFHDKFVCGGTCINEAILLLHIICSSYDHGRRYLNFHVVLLGNFTDL